MEINCVWEHNGNDTLLYAMDYIGAYTRGENLKTAMAKMPQEIGSYLKWLGQDVAGDFEIVFVADKDSNLDIKDADSDVLFESEMAPLTLEEYKDLKALALKSAEDFYALYESFPDQDRTFAAARKTFYGQVPRTAREMYLHTKNVNAYYFGEIGIETDNDGSILECRQRGFEALERKQDFLLNPVIEGSYGEKWTLRKMLRRFLWHDRIHGKAMYRMAVNMFGIENIPDVFCFKEII